MTLFRLPGLFLIKIRPINAKTKKQPDKIYKNPGTLAAIVASKNTLPSSVLTEAFILSGLMIQVLRKPKINDPKPKAPRTTPVTKPFLFSECHYQPATNAGK